MFECSEEYLGEVERMTGQIRNGCVTISSSFWPIGLNRFIFCRLACKSWDTENLGALPSAKKKKNIDDENYYSSLVSVKVN